MSFEGRQGVGGKIKSGSIEYKLLDTKDLGNGALARFKKYSTALLIHDWMNKMAMDSFVLLLTICIGIVTVESNLEGSTKCFICSDMWMEYFYL